MSAIAICVKTPGISSVKSRLAEVIGPELAERWFVLAAWATASVVTQSGAYGYWAVADDADSTRGHWRDHPVVLQSGATFGVRLSRVHAALAASHGAAIVIAADSPQLTVAELRRALDWLESDGARIAFGECTDGGFWLAGANRPLPEADWDAVGYGRDTTAAEFRSVMSRHGADWLELERLHDVDVADDLQPMMEALEALERPTGEQESLLRWMREQGLT